MQAYNYTDTRVKGPHINIKRDNGDPKSVVSEAKLDPQTGELDWERCCDRPMSNKMKESVDRFVSKLKKDKTLWRAARVQLVRGIEDMELDKKHGSKGDKDIATRNLKEWQILLERIDKDILD
ncbi:MAG: hypothetical protein RL329_266 [Bacteroidota bacterium]